MPIVGGLDIHRKQLTFDYPGTVTGEVRRGQIAPADREHLRAWLARFAGRGGVAFAVEGCTGCCMSPMNPARFLRTSRDGTAVPMGIFMRSP